VQRRTINPWQWQDQFGFSQAIEVTAGQQVLYCAGQTSVDAQGNTAHPGDIGAQIRQAMDNLGEVLSQAGYSLSDVVRLNVYTTDVDQLFASYGELVGRLAQAGIQPTVTLLGVTRLAFPELMVEIEATAVK
jgi:enamine deaminase RidA (YjgF/YER057c/UK114 family)